MDTHQRVHGWQRSDCMRLTKNEEKTEDFEGVEQGESNIFKIHFMKFENN